MYVCMYVWMDGCVSEWRRVVFPKPNNYFFSQVSPRTSFGFPGMWFTVVAVQGSVGQQ